MITCLVIILDCTSDFRNIFSAKQKNCTQKLQILKFIFQINKFKSKNELNNFFFPHRIKNFRNKKEMKNFKFSIRKEGGKFYRVL